MNRPIIISFGDPGGINPEILVKSLSQIYNKKSYIIIVGSINSFNLYYNTDKFDFNIKILNSKIYKKYKNHVFSYEKPNFNKKIFNDFTKNLVKEFIQLSKIDKYDFQKENCEKEILFFDPFEDLNFKNGKIDISNGFLSFLYLNISCELIKFFNFNASLITLPVNKKSVSLYCKSFTGHTDFLIKSFKCNNSRMLMHSKEVSILMETNHVPILELKKYLKKKHFLDTLLIATIAIKKLRLKNYIYVMGLNPHKSDESLIGSDEKNWIIPCIEEFKQNSNNKITVEGPFSSDSLFIEKVLSRKEHGIFIAWYHDQGLIPYKILSKGKGSNITIGLPFLRISPDHGTGFDIVGKNIADPDSLNFCFETIFNMEEE